MRYHDILERYTESHCVNGGPDALHGYLKTDINLSEEAGR
jgi:hypothetical protein